MWLWMSCKKGVFCIVNISLSYSVTMLPCVSDYSTFPLMICTLHIAHNVITSRHFFSLTAQHFPSIVLLFGTFSALFTSRYVCLYMCRWTCLNGTVFFFVYVSLFQFCFSFRMCSCFVKISTFLWILVDFGCLLFITLYTVCVCVCVRSVDVIYKFTLFVS